jgi:hypothetical protein
MPRFLGNREFLGGLVLVAVAASFLTYGWDMRVGTLTRMGPGFVPLTICAILLVMGALKMVFAIFRPPEAPHWPHAVPVLVVSLLPVAFGLLIKPLGLLLTTALVVVLSRLAVRERPQPRDVVVGLALGTFCVLTFIVGLSQSMSIWPRG